MQHNISLHAGNPVITTTVNSRTTSHNLIIGHSCTMRQRKTTKLSIKCLDSRFNTTSDKCLEERCLKYSASHNLFGNNVISSTIAVF